MRIKIIVVLIFLILGLSLFGQNPKQRYTGQTIQEILELPESEIDLGLACLVLAKELYPEINVNYYLQLIDGYAINASKISKGFSEPEARIGALNTCLYRKGKWNDYKFFEYNLKDLKAEQIESKFINCYLDSKQGSCITMPMLYLIIAQRLDWPIYAVIAPMHFFCRYVDPNYKENNIETTVGGGYDDDFRYIYDMGITNKSLKNGVYMRTLTNKEYIGKLLLINANEYQKRGDIDKAFSYLDAAVQIDSTDTAAIWNIGACFFDKAKLLDQKMRYELQAVQIEKELNEKALNRNNLQTSNYTRSSIVENVAKSRINPHQQISPGNNFSQSVQNNQNTFSDDIHMIKEKYLPEINYWLKLSQIQKQRAEDIGIVLEYPEIFFDKQKEDIEKFLKRGGYE